MDIITREKDLTMTRGDSCIRSFYIGNDENDDITIDNRCRIYMTVRNAITGERAFIKTYKSDDVKCFDGYPAGGIWKDTDTAGNPIYRVLIRPEDTASMNYYDIYHYDIKVTLPDFKTTLFYGRFEIREEVTISTDEEYQPMGTMRTALRPYLLNSESISTEGSTEGKIMFDSIGGNTVPGTITPAPTTPTTLSSVGDSGSLTVLSNNGNIFTYGLNQYTTKEATCTVDSAAENSLTVTTPASSTRVLTVVYGDSTGATHGIFLKKGYQYTVSVSSVGDLVGNVPRLALATYYGGYKSVTSFDSNTVHTFTNTQNTGYYTLYIYNSGLTNVSVPQLTITYSNFKIFQGDKVPDTWYLGKTNTQTLTLSTPLYSLQGGISDKLKKIDGRWGIERKCARLKFNGTESWTGDATTVVYNPNNTIANVTRQAGYCTHYPNEYDNTGLIGQSVPKIRVGSYNAGLSFGYIYFYYHGKSSLADFKAWLTAQNTAGTPITVIYPLKTSTWEALSQTEHNKIESLLSYNNTTIISTNSTAKLNAYVLTTIYTPEVISNE